MKANQNTTNTPELFLGIDVGKTELFCHLISPNETHSQCFSNSSSGIKSLLTWLQKQGTPSLMAACLEQTGHYGHEISKALFHLQIHSIYLVNPRQIKAYGNQKLRRNKSDSADAKLIAQFAASEHRDLRPWTPRSAEHQQIKELSRYADSLTQDNATLKARCESALLPLVLRSLKRRIKAQEKEIADIRDRIDKLIDKEQTLTPQKDLLLTIPGLGKVACQTVLAELPDITEFKDARQLAAWAGLTPRHHQSGTSGKTRTPITKVGSAFLRRALFMPAMSARTHNPLLKEFGDRLKATGKKPKQIIVAIMRKLLHQIYGILKSGQPFNPEKRGFNAPPRTTQTSTPTRAKN